ncbi:MAG: hypothetical protein K2H82_07560 [Oscillospiraceae bacterium]|nr:hypothetical protein [Oscillospiraceae bacterium]
MQGLQKLLNQKKYMKNLEIRKHFDAINNVWKMDLLLTISDMCWIAPHKVIIYDHAENQYESYQRFQLEEQEDMLNFFFEKAKILS